MIYERRWIIIVAIIWIAIIAFDELGYLAWRRVNPGAIWSGQRGQNPANVSNQQQ